MQWLQFISVYFHQKLRLDLVSKIGNHPLCIIKSFSISGMYKISWNSVTDVSSNTRSFCVYTFTFVFNFGLVWHIEHAFFVWTFSMKCLTRYTSIDTKKHCWTHICFILVWLFTRYDNTWTLIIKTQKFQWDSALWLDRKRQTFSWPCLMPVCVNGDHVNSHQYYRFQIYNLSVLQLGYFSFLK